MVNRFTVETERLKKQEELRNRRIETVKISLNMELCNLFYWFRMYILTTIQEWSYIIPE